MCDAGKGAVRRSHQRLGGRRVGLALTCLALSLARPAHAEDLVIESWVGGPSEQEQQWVNGLRDQLAAAGLLATPERIAQTMGPRMPLPPLRDEGRPQIDDLLARIAQARDSLAQAIALYRRFRNQAAEKLLASLIEEAQQNPLAFASERGRPVLREAMIYLALCRSRLRQAAAASATAEEIVRSFPGEAEKVFREFGPVADKLYRAAEGKLAAQGHGTLLIEVNDPEAIVIVNEGTANNRAFERDVPPGTYRVLVKSSNRAARRYNVPVRANETFRLVIDWQVDRTLALSPRSASLIFDSDRDRAAEGELAVSFARSLRMGPRVILLGSRIYDGYRALAASVYQVETGEHVKTALAVMDGTFLDAKLGSLKSFIVSGGSQASTEVIISTTPLPTIATPLPREPDPEPLPSRWPMYAAAFGAIATFGGGVALGAIDGKGTCDSPPEFRCAQTYGTAPLAYVLFGLSAGLTGYAAHRWTLVRAHPQRAGRRRPAKTSGTTLVPAPSGAAWMGWTF